MPNDTTSSNSSKTKSLSSARTKKKRKATYPDYVQFVEEKTGGTKKSIFSGDLVYFDKEAQLWTPVLSDPMFSSMKADLNEIDYFQQNQLVNYIHKITKNTAPSRMIRVPRWDNVDRLRTIARCMPCYNLDEQFVYELLAEWGVKMFRRLDDPHAQNEMIILKGGQGIGKDFLISALLDGLGQFIEPFIVLEQEKDNLDMLARSAVLHLSEFDRLNYKCVGTVKNLITIPWATWRPAHAAKAKSSFFRCSFIGSCNEDRMLRDSTGNRRFIILDIADIKRDYPTKESPQILAQWWALYKAGFKASPECIAAKDEHIKIETPPSRDEMIFEEYVQRLAKKIFSTTEKTWIQASQMLDDVFVPVSRAYSCSVTEVQRIVSRKGHEYYTRKKKGSFYSLPLDQLIDLKRDDYNSDELNDSDELPF